MKLEEILIASLIEHTKNEADNISANRIIDLRQQITTIVDNLKLHELFLNFIEENEIVVYKEDNQFTAEFLVSLLLFQNLIRDDYLLNNFIAFVSPDSEKNWVFRNWLEL